MTKLVNRAKMTTATTGTGTISLASAVDGYQAFSAAGVADADVVRYVIEDGDAWEIGLGTYTASGTTLTRGSIESSNADNALNLTGNAVVYVSAAAADLQELVDFADNFVLPTADGSTGQVLQTNGAGTLSFTTISGYTDADVDTHLNTGTASSGEVLSWTGSDYDWVAVSGGGAFTADGSNNIYAVATLPALTTGANNFVAGSSAGNSLSSGSDNILFGRFTGDAISTGVQNTIMGLLAGSSLTSGLRNVAIGTSALTNGTTAAQNVAIGHQAMGLGVVTGTGDNVAIGTQAGYDITNGNGNVLIGYSAGSNLNSGGENVIIGFNAGTAFTSATGVTVIGRRAGLGSTGSSSVIIGQDAQRSATGGSNNAIGVEANKVVTTGTNNSAFGKGANISCTTGTNNTALGNLSGGITTGSNNTVVGYQAAASSTTVSNEITLGNSSITRFRVPGAGIDNTSAALTGTTPSVDVGARDTYTLTTSGNTTFTFTGAPSSGQVGTFSLIITAGGTHTLTWPASVDWAGGTAPDAPASGEKDIYTFMTVDGGTNWYGFLAGDAMA